MILILVYIDILLEQQTISLEINSYAFYFYQNIDKRQKQMETLISMIHLKFKSAFVIFVNWLQTSRTLVFSVENQCCISKDKINVKTDFMKGKTKKKIEA